MAKLVKGMMTEEGFARAERAWMDTAYRAHIVLKMGLKRQIRMMLYYLGYEVERLTRTRIGWLQLKGLPKGGWKELTATEVERFFKEAPAKPALARKPAAEKEDQPERPSPAAASRKPKTGFKPKREGFKPRRSEESPRGDKPRGRSGPPGRRPASKGAKGPRKRF
jgi:23S rRNA pseudouridine2605 synthase